MCARVAGGTRSNHLKWLRRRTGDRVHQSMAKWKPAGVAAVCCGLLTDCAAPAPVLVSPPRSYLQPALLVHSHKFPEYPDVYQDTGRLGEVFASCQIRPDRRVTNCRVLAVEGGDAFGESVLDWVTYPDYRLPPTPPDRPDPRPGYHAFFVTFCPPTSGDIRAPISGGEPTVSSNLRRPTCACVRCCGLCGRIGGSPR